MAVTTTMEMVEIEMVEMETVEIGMETMEMEETTEMEIQMRMVEVLCQLLALGVSYQGLCGRVNPDSTAKGLKGVRINLVEFTQEEIRVDASFAMTWTYLMKLMTEVYCPRNEI
ncbi:hypothetical protein Tco_1465304 [Tanacetum coccineum]